MSFSRGLLGGASNEFGTKRAVVLLTAQRMYLQQRKQIARIAQRECPVKK